MSPDVTPKRKGGAASLRIVAPTEELTGVAPVSFERATKKCAPGDENHRGLIHISVALSQYVLDACTPPDTRKPFLAALQTASEWANRSQSTAALRKARSEGFNAIVAAERRATELVRTGLAAHPSTPHTELDPHADQVVLRYVGLAANYACGAVLMTLDGAEEPKLLSAVCQQAAGALAYTSTALGPARNGKLRASAWSQAEWEASRTGSDPAHGQRALAVQVLHEFLGGIWKEYSDAQRIRLGEFSEWALPTTPSTPAPKPLHANI